MLLLQLKKSSEFFLSVWDRFGLSEIKQYTFRVLESDNMSNNKFIVWWFDWSQGRSNLLQILWKFGRALQAFIILFYVYMHVIRANVQNKGFYPGGSSKHNPFYHS